MTTHQRTTPLIRLLSRLGWQRDPDLWTIPCRDEGGRRAAVLIRLTGSGVSITTPTSGPLRMTPMQIGRLRAALRDAALSFDRLSGTGHRSPATSSSRPDAAVPPSVTSPTAPRRIRARIAARPSVGEIAARLALTALSEQEAHHDHSDATPRSPGVVA
jgi:hypothetical protein